MKPQEIFDLLVATYGEAVSDLTGEDGEGDPLCRVDPGKLLEVARTLRDHPAMGFDFLESVTAIDWPAAEEIEVVYHFFSYLHGHRFMLRVMLPREAPRVRSLTSLWHSADWLEREQFDLMGVTFEGHPDPRRLLLPPDWTGHPLRKDYEEAPSYRGMPTTRPSPLDLLPVFDEHQQEQQGADTKSEVKP